MFRTPAEKQRRRDSLVASIGVETVFEKPGGLVKDVARFQDQTLAAAAFKTAAAALALQVRCCLLERPAAVRASHELEQSSGNH